MEKESPVKLLSLSPAQKLQFDIIVALSEPKIAAGFTVDVTALEPALIRWSREAATRITLNTAVVKAVALALQKYPTLALMPRGYRLAHHASIDIGISVAGREILAPVVVIRGAERKSLSEISGEVRLKGQEARRSEAKNMESSSRWVRWFPFGGLRRMILRRLLRSQKLRHQLAGCFQISNVSHAGVDWVSTATAANNLLMIGRRKKTPVVIKDQIELRTLQSFTLVGDHRTINGVTGGQFIRELRRLLQQPELLISPKSASEPGVQNPESGVDSEFEAKKPAGAPEGRELEVGGVVSRKDS